MRIITKKRDYYDSVQAHGQDQKKVYVRNEKKVKYDNFWKPLVEVAFEQNNNYFSYSSRSRVVPMIIGFAGKIYPLYNVYIENKASTGWHTENYVYSLEDFKALLIKTGNRNIAESFFDESKKKRRYQFSRKSDLETMREFFGLSGSEKFGWIFTKLDVPIFLIHRHIIDYWNNDYPITLHPCNLKELEFQRVLDPYTAFQELEMYISNVLKLNEPETIEIEDKYKVSQHGFDKWSFRKMPNKKGE